MSPMALTQIKILRCFLNQDSFIFPHPTPLTITFYDPSYPLCTIVFQQVYNFSMNENDLRVKRTRKSLQQALIKLVIEKGYDRVSIRDLTKEAEVGYKTFFRHHDSKESLLQATLNTLIQEFQEVTPPPTDSFDWKTNLYGVLLFADTQKPLMLALLNSPVADQLLDPLIDMTQRNSHSFKEAYEVPEELTHFYIASSLMTLVQWWLEKGTAVTLEEMIEYIDQLLIRPVIKLNQT